MTKLAQKNDFEPAHPPYRLLRRAQGDANPFAGACSARPEELKFNRKEGRRI